MDTEPHEKASCKLNLKKSEGRKRMYQVWSNFLNPGQIAMLGIVVTFLLTFLALKHPFSFLPSDHGREFAVNGGLSRGKLRGVGSTPSEQFVTLIEIQIRMMPRIM